jgi:hypothetical protein
MSGRAAAALAVAALALAGVFHPAVAKSAPPPGPQPSPIEIVLDTSESMSESDGSASGRIKIDGAKTALLDFLQQVEPQTPIGLRNYPGSGVEEGEEGCSAGDAQFNIVPRDPLAMGATIRTLNASGDTPTAAALEAAAEELRATGSSEGTIVLVSDGESNCGPDPCDTAGEIAESGIALQTITVGFRVSGEGARQLECIAEQTEGRYLSVHDNAGLAEAFDEISRPKLELTVNYPSEVTAEVGNDPAGLVRVDAEVSNPSQQLARGVVTRFRFDSPLESPAVTRPILYLGNLAPGESRKVSWAFRPGVPPSGHNPLSLPFSVLAGAQNTLADAEFRATIKIRDAYESAGDAGPILSSRRRIAILGDSYSSGEGASDYQSGASKKCHRSPHTYLYKAFSLQPSDVVACSGAVTANILSPQDGKNVDGQTYQLEALRKGSGVDAVAMTLGGNDIGFATIAASCLIGFHDCSQTIYESPPFRHGVPTQDFVDAHFKDLPNHLLSAYHDINDVANGPAARAKHGPVPILVMGYPLSTPLTARSCLSMGNLLSAGEIDFIDELLIRLNGAIQGAVEQVRKEGVPAFFVPNTEMAFQPDHTLCDREPYARALTSFRWSGQELIHPNAAGYSAETRAILRWTQSPDGTAADRLLERTPVAPPPQVTVTASGPDLGQLAPSEVPNLQGGSSYPLDLQGFDPSSPVTITAYSNPRPLATLTAAEDGSIATQVAIPPDLKPGDHKLVVSGVGPDGKPQTTTIAFRVAGGGTPAGVKALLLAGAAAAVAAALCALAFLVLRRRPQLPGAPA